MGGGVDCPPALPPPPPATLINAKEADIWLAGNRARLVRQKRFSVFSSVFMLNGITCITFIVFKMQIYE